MTTGSWFAPANVGVTDHFTRAAKSFCAAGAKLGDGDGERVFGYRALCLSRGDRTPLPGFDENTYVDAAQVDRYPFRDLVAEFEALRRANVLMLQNLPAEAWANPVRTIQGREVAVAEPV